MRRLIASIVPIAALLISLAATSSSVAAASEATGTATAPVPNSASCPRIVVNHGKYTYRVNVTGGQVSCATADRVLSDFFNHKGVEHGPKNGPASEQYWAVDGWDCGYGASSGACRAGDTEIVAHVVVYKTVG